MIAHLFSKVYLNFDISLRPVFDTLLITDGAYAIHESFINKHVGFGTHHGSFKEASDVDWKTFFSNTGSKRTVIYVNPINFGTVYFSFLKTINPDITYENARRIVEIILKRIEFYYVEYPIFGSNQTPGARKEVADHIEAVRDNLSDAWEKSQAWELDQSYIDDNLGIEYAVARYWANGSNEELVKQKLEQIYWKVFVGWGEEQMKNYSYRWLNLTAGATPDMFLPTMAADPELSWMADPDLDLEKTEDFKRKHDWSIIEKIFTYLKNDTPSGVIIETQPHWEIIVAKDWDTILNKENPMTLIVPAGEPVYRVLLNSWLISYFANLTNDQLREFVL
jgi:hypothetical protein